MVYSDTSTNLGLIQDITFLTGVGTTQYTLADRTRNINNWYLKTTSWIITADGRWQWDDANQTDRPCATTDLVNGQQDYKVIIGSPSTTQDWLEIDRVEILDSNGDAKVLTPIDQNDIGQALTEFLDTDGTPRYFDFRGGSIFLYSAPNYNSTGGLTIYFKRSPLLFASTDTTKRPGFATPFHKILSLGASYDWAMAKNSGNRDVIRQELEILKNELIDFYSKRAKYERPRLSRAYKNYK